MSKPSPGIYSKAPQTAPRGTQTSLPIPNRWQAALLIALQWLALTVVLAAAMGRSATALQDYITPNLDATWVMVLALLGGVSLGITVRDARLLYVLALLLPVSSATIFGAIIYLPAWQGIILRAVSFANYAQQQALFMGLWALVPTLIGATVGYVLAGRVRNTFDDRDEERRNRREGRAAAVPLPSWWDRDTPNTMRERESEPGSTDAPQHDDTPQR